MTKFGQSQPVRRVEDQRFITGKGRYTDDISLPNQAHGVFLRSPYAHAKVLKIDTTAAQAAPGVLAVYTIADLKAANIGDLPCTIPLKNRDGSLRADPARPALADGMVRHVGDPVAFVVAETAAQARDASELIEVDYDALPAAANLATAMEPGQPQIWAEAPNNRAFDWEIGDKAKVDGIFAAAAKTVKLTLENNRIIVASMEARVSLASFDKDTGRFALHVPTQGVWVQKKLLAKIFGLPDEKFAVYTADVGGGFGMKIFIYPEQVLTLFAARALGRPVKWTSERSEAFLTDTHGRANLTHAEMALDKDNHFLALRIHNIADMGAYLSTYAPMIPTMAGTKVLSSVYRFQAVHARVEGVFTNTVPVDAYRGAGRPESNYIMERLIDTAARELQIDRAELRRRNYIPNSAFPWTSAMGLVYDSGDFEGTSNAALKAIDWAGFEARRAAAAKRGLRRGIGMAYYLEATGGAPTERAEIRFAEDGYVDVYVGTQSTGQGHETAYTEIVSQQLGVDFDKIRIKQGNSDMIPTGGGTGGARSLYSQGGAILKTKDAIIDKGKAVAADMLETAAGDIEFAAGRFSVAGTDRGIGIMEVATEARKRAGVGYDQAAGLDTAMDHQIQAITFPNGCHVCEVEIDPATGVAQVVRYVVADDMGKVINPTIVKGQIHGGVVQGVGQALYEHVVYDEDGQLLTGSFTDYCMPRADNFPDIEVILCEVPCKTNPLGVKGAGEAGAVGSAPATISAIVDALGDLGITHVDMPATPQKIWQIIHEREAQAAE
ncbi:MAG: xanthine dehydrogenase family protein molybdopterin-binding subunit [Ferrovibrio sp.]|uniref:xanthine dehydrogenase family protein molybdopterin-binding subunit n=1 Tax=Ferrovibrio sp. TaxID=1917215 RepID=UPI002602CC55|nr:xanthine dehydrogenase family protein molybdopterin-binding subunit [Ferrovibrio sp.]MCW0232931.1 xanthine dehydrogenase family protein molybdopterin-binding subunit [Ferrovibrio sp.]